MILDLAHIAAPTIMKCYPDLVFLHISDAVAYAIKQKNLKKVWKEEKFHLLNYQ